VLCAEKERWLFKKVATPRGFCIPYSVDFLLQVLEELNMFMIM
jgi:hypothetical protein